MTEIQWTDKTQNPLKEAAGGNYCIPISPGCQNCYASLLNSRGTRFGGNGRKFGVRPEGHPEMDLNINMLQSWSRMRKPKKIFVGSMTDVFGSWVPDWMLFTLLDAMWQSPRQTFQVLTKRPERAGDVIGSWLRHIGRGQLPKNIWLGISAEDQRRLDERNKWLLRALTQVRFYSLEPLLGPIALPDCDSDVAISLQDDNPRQLLQPVDYIDWVIIGGESGPDARPMDPVWVEDVLEQCRAVNIPVFVKQLGSHWAKQAGAKHRKGGDPDEWPAEFRVRMFPGEAWNDTSF